MLLVVGGGVMIIGRASSNLAEGGQSTGRGGGRHHTGQRM